MKKKILIAILAIIVVVFLSGCIIFRDDTGKLRYLIYPINENNEEKNTSNGVKETSKTKEEETSTQSVSKSEEENEEPKVTEEQKEKSSSKNETVKPNSNTNSESTKNSPKNNTPSTSNNNSGVANSNGNAKQEEKPVVVQKQPWEELGLTEDQYKNQPMYSWEEVDFKTKEECMNYGNEHAEYGFECSEVTSWTRSLGWDYKTF